MNKEGHFVMTLTKLPEGGFVVSSGSRQWGETPLFASLTIDLALDFIENKLTAPADECKCGASK